MTATARAHLVERILDASSRAAQPLALMISALLFAQWPLRDMVGVGSTQANDLAQALFALYVAAAVRHATQRGAHLVARPDIAGSRLTHLGSPLCTLPWALFLIASAAPAAGHSVLGLERFPETGNPGYFVIKIALMLLGLMLAAQALLELRRAWRKR